MPVFVRGLNVLAALLEKPSRMPAKPASIPPNFNALAGAGHVSFVWPDPARQRRVKFAAQRLSRIEAPKFPDDETTLAQLRQRVADTIAYLQGLAPQAFDGAESRKVTLSFGDFKPEFQGDAYLLSFALPNFYFHVATAYGILRNQGVKIGKLDFLGPYPGLNPA